jgi:hypothetical protein
MMPNWVRLTIILAMACWCCWYFSKAVWIALTQGRVIDSNPYSNIPVTRESKPFGFWLFVVISAAIAVGTPFLIILIVGHLAGFWESDI